MPSQFATAAGIKQDERFDKTLAARFNGYFADFEANKEAVKQDLGKLVCFVSRGIKVVDRRDLADFESDVYIHCLEVIPRYRVRPFKMGVPAFDWFRKAINRKFWELTRRDLMIRRRSQSIDSVDEESIGVGEEVDKMAVLRSRKKQRSFVITDCDSARTVKRLLDHHIAKSVRAYSITTNAHEGHDPVLCIRVLQLVRKDLLGTYKRVLTPGVRYKGSTIIDTIVPERGNIAMNEERADESTNPVATITPAAPTASAPVIAKVESSLQELQEFIRAEEEAIASRMEQLAATQSAVKDALRRLSFRDLKAKAPTGKKGRKPGGPQGNPKRPRKPE
jgi:hypothetical protein